MMAAVGEPGQPPGWWDAGSDLCQAMATARGHEQQECKIKPRDTARCQPKVAEGIVSTPHNSYHIPTAGAALFHPLNQDISFPIAAENNRLLQLQPE